MSIDTAVVHEAPALTLNDNENMALELLAAHLSSLSPASWTTRGGWPRPGSCPATFRYGYARR